jgi:outer membrane protein assembly factor BamD
MKKALLAALILAVLASFPGCKAKKYENPIANDSSQPDKNLFDNAVKDLEHSRYEVARLTLQTMINTYPDSEYLAKAKLAVADSWYRQGGTSGLAQAEAEYKDFITFFPNMEEAVEAQYKVAMIHYNQMDKPDRDATHARRAEMEFKELLNNYPESKFGAEATQRLREVQEVLGAGEYEVGRTYFVKGANRAAVLRLSQLVDNYPYYSQADSALWMLGQSFEHGGKDFRDAAAGAYTRIIRDYPLSDHVNEAKARLKAWERPIPEPNPEALARMKYDQEHHDSQGGYLARGMAIIRSKPDVTPTTHSGDPTKVHLPPAPAPQEPTVATGEGTGAIKIETVTGEVNAPVMNPDKKPDGGTAPTSAPGSSAPAGAAPAGGAPSTAPAVAPAAAPGAAPAGGAPAANNPLSTPNATPDSAANKKAAADLAKKNNEEKKKNNPLSSLFHLGKKKDDKDKKDDTKKPDQPADANKPADPNKPAQPDDAKKPNVP